MTPVLYSFRRCPYAMRARLALQSSAMAVELREIELKNKPAALLAASPKGTVPVLVLPDRVMEQSLDIMLWALNMSASDAALELISQNDGNFKFHLDRYKYPHRYGLADGLEHRATGAGFLMQLEERLQQSPCLAGERWGLEDTAIAPFVRQFAHTDALWFGAQPWSRLARWLQDFENSVEFAGVMHKVPPWKPGDAPCITRFEAP